MCTHTEQNARNAQKRKKNKSKLRNFKQRGKKHYLTSLASSLVVHRVVTTWPTSFGSPSNR
ncbi:hypothetical protein N9D57_03575 [bacterium]|nr:hypothetical protein [bacterium]